MYAIFATSWLLNHAKNCNPFKPDSILMCESDNMAYMQLRLLVTGNAMIQQQ
jgi:hypothetical protein